MSGKPTRLAGPIAGTAAAAILFTAAGDLVVTDLQVANTTTAAVTFKMSIGADATGTRLFSDYSIPTGGVLHLDQLRWPFVARETLQWTAAATLTVTVWGEVFA